MRHAIPPHPDPVVYAVVGALAPLILATRERVARVEIAPEDLARLRALRGRPALVLPNHPSETEPSVMVAVALRVGEPFRYVATDEIFTGAMGWLLPRMGCLSIRRGRPDRGALRHCAQALAEGRKLVLFPEGETHLRHDIVLPLHRGAAQIGLWEAARRGEAMPAVPVLIRYHLLGDPSRALARASARLEVAVGLEVLDPAPLPVRLRRVGVAVLEGVEREYGLRGDPASVLERRIAAVLGHIEARVVAAVGMRRAPAGDVPTRMRALFNAVFDFRDALEGDGGIYARRLVRRRRAMAQALLADLWRVQNFMAMDSAVLPDTAGPEQLAEMVSHFEREVFGRPRTRLWRVARVRVGEAVPVEAGAAPRRARVEALTRRIEDALREMLARERGTTHGA